MDGIRNKIEPPPQLEGNVYFAKDLLTIPQSLVLIPTEKSHLIAKQNYKTRMFNLI